MDKRTFLKTSSLLAGSLVLSRLTGCGPEAEDVASHDAGPLTNWAGNLTYGTTRVDYPTSVEEVQALVRQHPKLRPLGTRHSFSAIADSTERLVSLERMNRLVGLDHAANTVTVEPGMKYGDLSTYLHDNGLALHNLASLPHISVAGSCATATHGSGVNNGNLATAVSALEFVNAAGDVVSMSRQNDGELFEGAVVGLGGLGVVTRMTLDVEPTYDMRQVVYRNLPMQALEDHFLEIMSGGYSVSLFTNWANRNVSEVWVKSRMEGAAEPAPELYGAQLADRNLHPVEDQSAESCTEQMGVPGPWYARLPHFKMGFTPSTGAELQAEYFVPIERGYEAMMAMEALHEQITPHLFISEIRSVDADRLWMSPCYNRACVALHTTWKPEPEAVMALIPQVEARLAPFGAVPHWGKLFTLTPQDLEARFPRMADFRKLLDEHDPEGKFRNAFLNRNVFGA